MASLPLDRTEELRRDPRLADTRLAEDRDEAAAPALDRRRELAAQGSELAASPDECRSRVPQPGSLASTSTTPFAVMNAALVPACGTFTPPICTCRPPPRSR